MNQNSVFRANARAQLGGSIFSTNWLMALLVCLIGSAIIGVANSMLGVGDLLLTAFFTYGMAHVFLQLIRGQKDKIDVADLFKGTDHIGDLIILSLLQQLFTFLWTLLFIIPGIVKSYAYAMAAYLKYDHPEYDWRQCLDESQRWMDGYKWQLFCLDFSFIGWYFVGGLCCGVGALWVTPYREAARANFYENLRAIHEPVYYEAPVNEPAPEAPVNEPAPAAEATENL
ncbi:MAG: DUF975 family protein [Clostridia bacterium]|nr:DUF975 family protein [Clostridia bacterium]